MSDNDNLGPGSNDTNFNSSDPVGGNPVGSASHVGGIPVANTGNGEIRPSSRSLMVRDYDANMLSPYMMPAGAPYVDGTPSGLSFSQLAHALRRRWLLAVCVALLVGLPLAALVWLVTPENYEVVAWLHVGDPPSYDLGGTKTMRNATEYEQYRKTQAARIESPLVLNSALNRPGISDLPMLREQREPVKFLEDELIVVAPLESEVLLIKMRGRDARQLMRIVNAVKESYLTNIVEAEKNKRLNQQALLDSQYKANMADIYAKRGQVNTLAEKYHAPDLEQVKVKLQQLQHQSSTLFMEIMDVRSDLMNIRARIAVLKNKDETPPPDHELEFWMSRDQVIAEETTRLGQIRQALTEQLRLTRRGSKDAMVQQLEAAMADSQRRIEERRAEIRPSLIYQLEKEMNRDSGAGDLADLQSREQALSDELKNLEAEHSKLSTEASTMSQKSADIDSLLNEIEQLEHASSQLAGDLETLKIELSLPPRVTSLEDASLPEGANPIFRYVLTLFAGLIGLAIGSGTVVTMEYQAHRLNTSGELSTNTGLRVLGTMPSMSSLSRAKGLNGAAAMQGILSESVDSIRTILLQQSPEDAPHVIMISSAGDREGKTTVASHLAGSLARAGRRTLLIDGDLRSPSVHTMYGVASEPGLCEVLRGEIDLEGAIQPTQVDGLMVVAGGACDYHAIAALSKAILKTVLQKAREQFEFIVIDGAPVLTYADTLLIGAHVDAAVLSVRRDVSQIHRVNMARDRFESVGIRVLGAVVNGITETSRRPAYALPAPV